MKRHVLNPRSGWKKRVEDLGFSFHSANGKPYWDEFIAYSFSSAEIETIEKATQELYEMCLSAAAAIIENGRYAEMKIPQSAIRLIEDSWERETPSVYGRFDLAWDGTGHPKLLEYNAQTPTSLLEAAEVQWAWKEDTFPCNDQFTSLEPKLKAQWKECAPYIKGTLYFTSTDTDEDRTTVEYMMSMAESAHIATRFITVDDIGWDAAKKRYVDLQGLEITNLFALYPWEWLLREQGSNVAESWGGMTWMEPAWKMLWSNKALLAILWELFPHHPNLLETVLDGPRNLRSYVKKPIYSREGANVTIVDSLTVAQSNGPYGEEGYVYQKMANLARLDGKYAVIGSWYVTDQGPAGIGIRESDGPITDNLSRFVPHYIDGVGI